MGRVVDKYFGLAAFVHGLATQDVQMVPNSIQIVVRRLDTWVSKYPGQISPTLRL